MLVDDVGTGAQPRHRQLVIVGGARVALQIRI
jgi:hypothetical protein